MGNIQLHVSGNKNKIMIGDETLSMDCHLFLNFETKVVLI